MTAPRLDELDFGDPAAESDEKLVDYFVLTPAAESIVKQKVGFVLGRKGSGKTALFRQAEELLREFGMEDVQIARLNLDDHAWAAFSGYKKLGLSVEHAATVSWHLALLVQVAARVVAMPWKTWSKEARTDVNVLRQFIQDNFGEVTPTLQKSSALIGQVQSLKVGAFGASLEASFGDKSTGPRELAPALTDTLMQHLAAPLEDTAWLVLLDQLDDSWDGSPDNKALLVGLQKAVKRMNDAFGWRTDPRRGLRAISFLRTDIDDVVEFDDKDKHRKATIEISWTPDKLREMVQTRLGGVPVDSIFESATTQRKGRISKGSFNYLVSRTFMRPRDLILFLGELQKTAPSATQITKAIVVEAEKTYSKDKVTDLRNEYRKGSPWVDDALEGLKQGPNKYDSRVELEERLASRIKLDDLKSKGMPSISDLIDWMVEVSILGSSLRKTKTETINFRCEGQPVSLEGESAVWVHPLLFSGLSLTEPRVARA